MTADIIRLDERRRPSARLLAAAKQALEALDNLSIEDFANGKDAHVRAELKAAIDEEESRT